MNEKSERILEIIAEQLRIPRELLQADTNLRELPDVDSISMVRVVARIEDEFGIELDEDIVFQVATARELGEAIDRLAEPAEERS